MYGWNGNRLSSRDTRYLTRGKFVASTELSSAGMVNLSASRETLLSSVLTNQDICTFPSGLKARSMTDRCTGWLPGRSLVHVRLGMKFATGTTIQPTIGRATCAMELVETTSVTQCVMALTRGQARRTALRVMSTTRKILDCIKEDGIAVSATTAADASGNPRC